MPDSARINNWYQNLTRQQRYWIRQITPQVLDSDIIIDFEGMVDEEPELVGVWNRGSFETVFLSSLYSPCTSRYSNSRVESFQSFCRWIDNKISEGHKIIAYSTLEGSILLPHVTNKDISYWYRDAHKYFKRLDWGALGVRRPRPLALSSILEVFGIAERRYGKKVISQYIQYAKRQLNEGRSFEDLSTSAKRKLTSAVNYNEDDVCCLKDAIIASFKM